ncbi:hypothetical protein SNE40_019740 [Patella caerulea]|uniref:Amino acid transporter transmembrane domain-containing protein n=1 Tax=Patella caerulea TaxID=87958 RepID=A0AAN8PAW0_PATCE
MADETPESGTQYSTLVGVIYVFNLIVGTGALTMPAAFHSAGWLVSLILVIFLALTSFITVTFVAEAMSVANAKEKYAKVKLGLNEVDGVSSPLLGARRSIQDGSNVFDITQKIELGRMAEIFFNKVGEKLFYACIVIYLYGDLSIYAAAVPKSLRDVSCTYRLANNTDCNKTLSEDDLCWDNSNITRMNVYRMFVAIFLVCLGPFTFFNVQKTKYLQIITTIFRWLAFGIMIVLAVMRLSNGEGKGHPAVGNLAGIPNLFGVCVYSFMCHHSLPSLITPIKDKSSLYKVLGVDYVCILIFYALLSFTGIFAFATLEDLYTLNFFNVNCETNSVTNIKFIQYFLALFPVFTLSTNFPIISITLRNNLQTMFSSPERQTNWTVHNILFPLLALLPSVAIAFGTNQVEILVGITGSYAGAGIQYVIPALLVYYARKDEVCTSGHDYKSHCSPFKHKIWIILVLIWSACCIGFVTVNHIITRQ